MPRAGQASVAILKPDPQPRRLEALRAKHAAIGEPRQPEAQGSRDSASDPVSPNREQPRDNQVGTESDGQTAECGANGCGLRSPNRALVRRGLLAHVTHGADPSRAGHLRSVGRRKHLDMPRSERWCRGLDVERRKALALLRVEDLLVQQVTKSADRESVPTLDGCPIVPLCPAKVAVPLE